MLPLAGSRADLNFLLGEVVGELGNSHTYVSGGDEMPEEKRVGTAYLGADFALDPVSGRYKLASVFPGDNTREKYRAPLTVPSVDVRAGEYLLSRTTVSILTCRSMTRRRTGCRGVTCSC